MPAGFELGFPEVPLSLPSLSLHGRIYVKHSSCGTQTTFYTALLPSTNLLAIPLLQALFTPQFCLSLKTVSRTGFLPELPTHQPDPHHKATPPKAPTIQSSHWAPCFPLLDEIPLWQ